MAVVKRRAEAIWIESRNRWQINVQREGLRKTFISSTPGRKGKHEAEAKADKWLERYTTEQKLSTALELFLEDKETIVTQSTYMQIKGKVNKIQRFFPPFKKLSAITLNDWQGFLDAGVANGESETTLKAYRAFVHEFATYCKRKHWEVDTFDTEELIIRKTAKPKKEKEAYGTDEIKALLSAEADKEWWINGFRFLLFTGFRKNEACALKWEDVDFEKKIINVWHGMDCLNNETSGKTENVIRKVALSKVAENVLEAQRKKLADCGVKSEYIFPGTKGAQINYNSLQNYWRKVKAYGIKHTIHEMRHTFVSLTDKELALALLKKSVGHSAAMATQKKYSHITEADLNTMRQGIDKAFSDIDI